MSRPLDAALEGGLQRAVAARDRAGRAAADRARTAGAALLALPPWAQALLVWAASRLLTTLITLGVAPWQEANLWTRAAPGYGAFTADLWDATWYRSIAEHGYPLPLPRGEDGAALQSEWAFYPAYPLLVRAIVEVTGGSWQVVAPTTALVLSGLAAVVLLRLFRAVAAPAPALVGLALVLVFPAAAVLQYAYTESLGLLAVSAALLALVRRRYAWCAGAVVLLGATRAVALPLAAVVVVHGLARWRASRTPVLPADAFGARSRAAVAALAALAVAAGLAWPLAVGAVTGEPDAYTQVQAAWRGGSLTWLLPWWTASQQVLGPLGPLALLLALAALVWWCTGPRARALGPELPTWVLALTGYLLLVLDPWTSTVRYWLLQVPLALLLATSVRSRAAGTAWIVASALLQVVWVAWLWRFTPPSDFAP